MRRFLPFPLSIFLKPLVRIAAIILVIVGALWLYTILNKFPGYSGHRAPFTLSNLFRFGIHQYDVGFLLQLTFIPAVLLCLLSILPFFRRTLEDQTVPHATTGIFVGFVLVQLLSQSYVMWTSRSIGEIYFVDLLVITIGSLLVGWRIGLSLGVISMLYQGSYEFFIYSPFPSLVRDLGLYRAARDYGLDHIILYHYFNPHISAGVWTGVLACMCADLLGPRRYSPLAASGLGAGLVFVVGYLRFAAGIPYYNHELSQVIITGLAAGVVMLIIRNFQTDAARRTAEAAELVRTQAELRALRAQINPHFLFNSLNTIRYTTRTDPETARRLLLNLSEIFQRTLRSGDFISLRDELSYIEAYLSLEKARLDERLQVVWGGVLQPELPLQTETPLLDQPVPTLALQPLVENAVIHGIGKKKEGGTVTITVEHLKPDLVIKIEDDGVGIDPIQLSGLLTPGNENRSCIGLCNVDRRLRLLYGEDHRLVIESEVGRGTRVIIRIPVTEP
jgi:signal transduction histidine kinase